MAKPETEIEKGVEKAEHEASLAGMTGLQKAAIFMITIGKEASTEVFKCLKPDELERLANELVRQENVSIDRKKAVFNEFGTLYQASNILSQGGIDYAKEVLEEVIGPQKAQALIEKIIGARGGEPSEWLQHVDPAQLARLLQNEQPQTMALVIAQIPGPRAAMVLQALDPDLRIVVTKKLARMETASPEVVVQIEDIIRSKLIGLLSDNMKSVSGVDTLVEILNSGNRSLERSLLESLSEEDPALAEEIKRKLFVFEDIILLEDRAVQVVLREIDQDDLRLALRGSPENLKEKIFKNMSERAAEAIKEDLEMSGPVRLKDVEAAQQRIALGIRALEESGEIVISRGGQDAEDTLV